MRTILFRERRRKKRFTIPINRVLPAINRQRAFIVLRRLLILLILLVWITYVEW